VLAQLAGFPEEYFPEDLLTFGDEPRRLRYLKIMDDFGKEQ
jgi:hypothetical protein